MKTRLSPAQLLKRRTQLWAVRLRVNPRVIQVRDMRRKWGSCSSAGTITLAWDLTRREAAFQDFVVVHELLHLRHPNHGRVFKALLAAHVPQWRRLQASATAPSKR
jgi:predicted metal-dependent hydrolase